MLWMLTFAHAATWTVSPAPAGAAWVGDAVINGSCRTAGGACTLRAAIDEANAAGGPQTIQLPAGDFPLPITISLSQLTITGAGMGSTRISQTGGTVLRAVDATLSDLTISGAGARTTDPVITGSGGPGWHATIRLERVGLDALRGAAIAVTNSAVYDTGTGVSVVELTDVAMRRGVAPLVSLAGGYYNPSVVEITGLQVTDAAVLGSLFDLQFGRLVAFDVDVRRSSISGAMVRAMDSAASFDGATFRQNQVGNLLGVTGGPAIDFGAITYTGLSATGNLSAGCGASADAWSYIGLDDSVVASNTLGGAVLCGQVHVTRSTIANNTIHAGDGGAIRVSGYLPYDAWVRNSLIAHNHTTGSGGGIWTDTPGGADTVEILGTTLLGNVADSDLDGLGEGGNLWSQGASLESTVLAGGIAGGAPSDCVGTFVSARTNFVGVEPTPGACAMGGANTVGSPLAPADPMLSALLTLPNGRTAVGPLRGSPLIDAGTLRGGLDLGGQSRAMDGDGDGVPVPDIGAVERPIP